MKILFSFLTIIFCFAFSFVNAQNLKNVDFKVEGDNIIVTYDLLDDYGHGTDISILFSDRLNNKIKPAKIFGDINEVKKGMNKRIIWSVLEDTIGLFGEFKLSILQKLEYEGKKYNAYEESHTGYKNIYISKTFKLSASEFKPYIKSYVENKITSWQQKGEFEKTSDYALRVSEENRKQKIAEFQKQCIDELALAEERKIYASYKNFTLQKYDADAETYLIDANTYGNIILKVPLASAPEFKEKWNTVTIANPHFEFTGEDFVLTHLDFLISDKKKFSFDISEKYKYTSLNIEYKFNPVEVDVSGKKVDNSNPNISQKKLVVGKADVDYFDLIPQTKTQNPDAIAVIIGNSNYANTKPVAYAINDAESMKNYLIKTLGFKEGNILMKENATLGDFNTLFGTKDNQRGRLANTIKEGVSDVFIFYAGHGAPGLKDNKGYFVPVECDPNYVENSGYQLDIFYQNIAQLKAKSVTIILDACFSGSDIFENTSPIVVKVKDPILLIPNAVVITSSSGTEVSTWYEEKQHGMFTYFFLKAIQDKEHSDKNKDGQLTFDEVYDYVSNKNEGVPYYARRIHGIDQTPTIMGDMKDKVFIKY